MCQGANSWWWPQQSQTEAICCYEMWWMRRLGAREFTGVLLCDSWWFIVLWWEINGKLRLSSPNKIYNNIPFLDVGCGNSLINYQTLNRSAINSCSDGSNGLLASSLVRISWADSICLVIYSHKASLSSQEASNNTDRINEHSVEITLYSILSVSKSVRKASESRSLNDQHCFPSTSSTCRTRGERSKEDPIAIKRSAELVNTYHLTSRIVSPP